MTSTLDTDWATHARRLADTLGDEMWPSMCGCIRGSEEHGVAGVRAGSDDNGLVRHP